MPRCDGVEATRRLTEALPATRIVVLTTYADDRSVVAALRAGAAGYLTCWPRPVPATARRPSSTPTAVDWPDLRGRRTAAVR